MGKISPLGIEKHKLVVRVLSSCWFKSLTTFGGGRGGKILEQPGIQNVEPGFVL